MLSLMDLDSQDRSRSWNTRKEEKDRRLANVKRFATGHLFDSERIVDVLEKTCLPQATVLRWRAKTRNKPIFCHALWCASIHPEFMISSAGLEEGWRLAKHIREVIDEARTKAPRPVVAIVDVPSQAYGRREELLGIHLACAAAANAYADARLAGHPVISLVVGKALSDGFLAHGY